MNNNYWDNRSDLDGSALGQTQSSTLSQFLTQVYTWMALGLAITGFMAVMTVTNPVLYNLVFGSGIGLMLLIVMELGLVFGFTMALARGVAMPALLAMFLTYSALNGMTLSAILLVYTHESVARVFFISAGAFGGLSLFGFVTKKDLSAMGRFMVMGLIGIIIASIVNIFIGSTAVELTVSLLGVVIFSGLTAWDTQKLKVLHYNYANDEANLKRLALHGALLLYLDFINLFLMLLRLMGRRK